MKYRIGITPLGFLVVALLGLPTDASATVIQDDINAALVQPDGSRAQISFVEVAWQGKTKRSFGIREVGEWQAKPGDVSLVVVSTRPLPISSHWACDVQGVLSTYSGISRRDGMPVTQRILIVSPEDVLIYCSPKGYPLLYPPLKSFGIDWCCKRSIVDLESERAARRGSTSTLLAEEEAPLPPMPDSPYSMEPVYCETIADAEAEYSDSARNLVELHCRPFSNVTSTTFTLGQDNPADSITVYFSGSSNLPQPGRINTIVGAIQKGQDDTYWIEVDSAGPNWEPGDDVGGVQAIAEGTIAWAKTFADTSTLPSPLSGKVVSRTFPSLGYFYIQETGRASGSTIPVWHHLWELAMLWM